MGIILCLFIDVILEVLLESTFFEKKEKCQVLTSQKTYD